MLRQIFSSQPASIPDQRFCSLETSCSSVKSLGKHFSTSSPLESSLYKRLWKSNSPRRISISIWIMLFGNLNCALVLQRKLPSLSPHVCSLCVNNMESIQHLLFDCVYDLNVGSAFSKHSIFVGFFYHAFKNNVSQILAGPNLKSGLKETKESSMINHRLGWNTMILLD